LGLETKTNDLEEGLEMGTKRILRNALIGVACGVFLTCTALSIGLSAGAMAGKHATSRVKASKAESRERTKQVQEALNKTSGADLKVDGIMGKQSRAAIKKYQKDNGLKVTGKPDQETLAKLGVK
jgi:peptidoglycan hydrolase-like protein with peptidoglycan-binding domain